MQLNIEQAKAIIRQHVAAQLRGEHPSPIMLRGAPGLGKSACIHEIADELNIGFIDIRLAQMDPVDLRGLPMVDKNASTWVAPDFLPQDQKSVGILFLDELSAADSSLQVVAYQLILDHKCGSYTLPPGWYICAAGNRAEDNAVSIPMSSALANRFLHLELVHDSSVWCKWAVKNGIAPEIIGFIRSNPDMLFALDPENCQRGWPSPRSWAGVSKLFAMKLERDEFYACVSGLVGEVAVDLFLAYLKNSRTLGDIHAVMLDPKSSWQPPKKNDMLYAVATAIAYWVQHGSDESESARLLDGFFRISFQLPATFAVVAMIDAMEGSCGDELANRISAHPEMTKWQDRFSPEMQKQKGVSR